MAFDAPVEFSLEDKYALDTTRTYLTGIEALVRLPILQHQRHLQAGLNTAGFISGYRGSPLGGLDQALWKAQSHLDEHNIVFQPGVNEDLAATAVWGSQQVNLFEGARYDGVFSMWYGKGPGVDRSLDAVRHANAAGTSKHGGVLFIAGDDHACKSSTLPHQTDHVFIGASMPLLNPADVQDILDLGIFGWELSRYSGCRVAMKAITENMDCATLNQTGLAQKFGSVFSHVRIGRMQDDIHTARIAAGDADLLLGCDMVVASSFDSLAKLHIERSHAVVNEHVSPTSEFLRHPDMKFPADAMKAVISEETGAGRTRFVEATGTATRLLGDAVASNMFLLGYAWQAGLVPVGRDAIFKAIEVNNVAVKFNKQAFTWGRRAAFDPEAVHARLDGSVEPFRPLDTLDEIVDYRVEQLTRYQDAAYAEHYRTFVDRVHEAETDIAPGEQRLAKAVARSLFKLMAYKDEYEVARLFTDGEFARQLNQ